MLNLRQGNQLALGLAGKVLKLANTNVFTTGGWLSVLLSEIILILRLKYAQKLRLSVMYCSKP